jgi:hypothetical protein
MHEFGQDAGTFTRVLFNFSKEWVLIFLFFFI